MVGLVIGDLLDRLRRRLLIDSGDYRKTVILAGTGRSGTTWIEEIINAGNDFRVMFEPFHQQKVPLLRDWSYRQYLRPDERSNEYLGPAEAILRGKVRNGWIDQFNERIFSNRRLIKDIRIQLMLKWISEVFPEIPIILLMRHPCAVAASKLKLGWDTHLDEFLSQQQLMQDYLEPHRDVLTGAEDAFDRHLLMWCVENYVPLKQFAQGEILVLFYEHLCTEPHRQVDRIFSFIGMDAPEDVLRRCSVPSALSRKESAIVAGTDMLDGWRRSVDETQIERALEILGLFGLDTVYGEGSLPKLNEEDVLCAFDV